MNINSNMPIAEELLMPAYEEHQKCMLGMRSMFKKITTTQHPQLDKSLVESMAMLNAMGYLVMPDVDCGFILGCGGWFERYEDSNALSAFAQELWQLVWINGLFESVAPHELGD
jgi:hypothetical protein